jgi:hypothetical protein
VRIYLGNAPTDMVVVWTTFGTHWPAHASACAWRRLCLRRTGRAGGLGDPESSAVSRVEYGLVPGQYTMAVDGLEYTYDAGVFGTHAERERERAAATGSSADVRRHTPGWDGFMHKARLAGLQTFTRYYYRVGDGVTWSPEFTFRTAPAPGQRTAEVRLCHRGARRGCCVYAHAGATTQPIRHLLTGDMGTFMPFGLFVADEMAQLHRADPYDMLIHMGDVACTCAAAHGEWVATCSRRGDARPRADGGTSGSPDGFEWQVVWDFWGRQVEPIGANVPYMVSVGTAWCSARACVRV